MISFTLFQNKKEYQKDINDKVNNITLSNNETIKSLTKQIINLDSKNNMMISSFVVSLGYLAGNRVEFVFDIFAS